MDDGDDGGGVEAQAYVSPTGTLHLSQMCARNRNSHIDIYGSVAEARRQATEVCGNCAPELKQ